MIYNACLTAYEFSIKKKKFTLVFHNYNNMFIYSILFLEFLEQKNSQHLTKLFCIAN